MYNLSNFVFPVVLSCSLLVSCSDGVAVDTSPVSSVELTRPTITELQTGYLLDSAVEGINYITSDGSQGKTDKQGAFNYYYGDEITFLVGGIVLGRVQTEEQYLDLPVIYIGARPELNVTPVSLSPGAKNSDDNRVINRLIFLQTLDNDGAPENGIQISPVMHDAMTDLTMDFDLPVNDFVSGAFASLVDALNTGQIFSKDSPRTLRSKIDVLRHFGDLNLGPFNFSKVTTTYSSWWLESNGCNDIGASAISISKKRVTFCPNVKGLDGCYDGVVQSNGDILMPDMQSNFFCATYDQGTSFLVGNSCAGAEFSKIKANLKYVKGKVFGTYQASCNDSANNSLQTVTAKFRLTRAEGEQSLIIDNGFNRDGYSFSFLNDIKNEIDGIIATGSCTMDSDCKIMTLKKSYNCSVGEYKAYPMNVADIDELRLNEYIFNEVTSGIQYNQSSSTVSICIVEPLPTSRCVNSQCQINL